MDQDFSHDVAGFVDAFIYDPVQYSVSRTSLYHHLSVTHDGQVLRNVRLPNACRHTKIAHALLTLSQLVQNL
jgi:hypothetical protein